MILEDILAFVAGITAMGCLTGIIITYMKRRSRQLPSPELNGRLDEITARLGHLDTAIDTVAIEIERISEAQRFTAKVLAERSGGPAIPDKSRSGPPSLTERMLRATA